MLPHHTNYPKRVLRPITAFCAWLCLMTASGIALGAEPRTPIAQVVAVIVGGQIVGDPQPSQVLVTRASEGCGNSDVVRKGLPLCAGDRIKTSVGVTLTVAFGDPKDKNEVVVLSDCEITISSVDCRVCHWWSSWSSRFTNRVQNVALTNSGTVYEVAGLADQTVTLNVYEGEVEITRMPPPETSNSDSTASTPQTTSAAPVKVGRLSKAIIRSDGTVDRVAMTETDLRIALALSTASEVWVHRKPAEAGGSVAKLINFRDDADRNDKFESARADTFWKPEQPEAFETLGKIYNDWGDPEKSLVYFEKALKLRRTNPSWEPPDDISINKANALRQAHKYDEGLIEVNRVIDKEHPTFLGDALNVRGSIYYDQARLVLRTNQTQAGIDQARSLLDKANQDYQKVQTTSGPQLQYTQVNLGQVLRTQGDILQREKRYDEAAKTYTSAIETLKKAYGPVGVPNPQNKIASLLVARARSALANNYASQGKRDMSIEYYARAEETFLQLIKDAADAQQRFAEPYCGLASLYQVLGRDAEAQKNYGQCLNLNVAALVVDAEVPNVTELTRAAAIQTLAEAGLEAEIDNVGEFVESQQPAAPQTVRIGSRIKLHLRIPDRD
jgi:tetratricopeptide (TPR) repeat protein